MTGFLPYGRQQITDDDVEAVTRVLRSNFLTTGPEVEKFEAALADEVGAGHAVACSSGTAALHLAGLAAGVGSGDVAIVPAITFVATANAMRMCGADIVFADVNPDSGLMEGAHLKDALTRAGRAGRAEEAGPAAKVVLPVHLTGQCTDMAEIGAIAQAASATIISDACHALGAEYSDAEGAGKVGDGAREFAACFSFHPVKSIAMGEGGAVTTNDAAAAARMRSLRHHGIERDPAKINGSRDTYAVDGTLDPHYHEFSELGFNYRASDIHCALGTSQLSRLDSFVATRRSLAAAYASRLAGLGNVLRPIDLSEGCRSAWHIYPVLIDFDALGISRADVVMQLRERGIGTQVHYAPVNGQPYYRELYGEQGLPGAEAYYRRTLSLPMYADMTGADVDTVVAALQDILA